MLWTIVVDQDGSEEAEERLQRVMGNRGPGVNPSETTWGLNATAQAGLERMMRKVPKAKPVDSG